MLRSIKQLFLILLLETLLMVIFFRLRRAIGKVKAKTEGWSIEGQKMSMKIFVEDVKFRRLDNKIRKMFEFIWGEKFTDIRPTDSAGVFTTMESEFKKWGIPVKIEYRIHGTSLIPESMILQMKVYKYQHHKIENEFEITMPASARVVGFEIIDAKPTIWALIDPKETNNRVKRFRLVGTGDDINIEKDPQNLIHIATVHDKRFGDEHLFEILYGEEAYS